MATPRSRESLVAHADEIAAAGDPAALTATVAAARAGGYGWAIIGSPIGVIKQSRTVDATPPLTVRGSDGQGMLEWPAGRWRGDHAAAADLRRHPVLPAPDRAAA